MEALDHLGNEILERLQNRHTALKLLYQAHHHHGDDGKEQGKLCRIILNEEKSELRKRIDKLDSMTRDVMYLRIYGELSFSEIGIIKGKNENLSRVTFYRGKNKIMESNLNE